MVKGLDVARTIAGALLDFDADGPSPCIKDSIAVDLDNFNCEVVGLLAGSRRWPLPWTNMNGGTSRYHCLSCATFSCG